jgi:hypothetical protein
MLFKRLNSCSFHPILLGLILLCSFVCCAFSPSVFADPVSGATIEELRQNADQEITVKKIDSIDIGLRKFASKDDPKGEPVYFGREALLNFLYKSSSSKHLLVVKLDMNHASDAEVDTTIRALESFFRDLQYQRVVIYSESDGNVRTVSDTKYEQPEEDVSLPKYNARSILFYYYPPRKPSGSPEYRVDMGLGGPMNLKSASSFLQQVKHKDENLVVRLAKNASQKFVEPYLRNLGFANLQFERDPRVSPLIADEHQASGRHGKRARRRGK